MSEVTLPGKVAVITGGSRGIGKSIALNYAEAGADVVVCSRTGGGLQAVADEITSIGRRSLALEADVTQKSAVDGLVSRTMEEFGHIDILVNNAGIGILQSLVESNEADWDKVFNVNLKGCYLCSKAVSEVMVRQKRGNIVNISSIRGVEPYPGRIAYCVSKAGVIMLTRVMALELASHNIRVNAIAPGLVKTELTKPLWGSPKTLAQLNAEIPMNRWGNPEEIASVALFLASDASSYVTGHTVVVSGGSVV